MRVGVHTVGWCKIGAPLLLEICRCVWIRPCTFSFPSAQPLLFRHSTVCALRCMWGEDVQFWRSPLPARASCSLHPSIFPSPGSLPSALLCVIQPWHTPCSMALHSTNTHAHARRTRRGTFLPLGPSPPPFWGRAGYPRPRGSPHPFPSLSIGRANPVRKEEDPGLSGSSLGIVSVLPLGFASWDAFVGLGQCERTHHATHRWEEDEEGRGMEGVQEPPGSKSHRM